MSVNSYIASHKERFLNELLELLRIPSVSADPKFKDEVFQAAEFVKSSLESAGVDRAEICATTGYPIVYGEKIIDPSAPTVLVYGHYDVQPADPYELWDSPPFEPIIKPTEEHPEGAIFARGSADDKGQFYMHVKAFEAMLAAGELACNVKFMIEGEEEVGSENLDLFVKGNVDKLKADVVLISDTSMISMETPSVTVGLRGLAYMQVEVTGPNRDLHSGTYGGAVANPINALAKMIASLHDENNRITIPGFYDRVEEYSADYREQLNKAPFDEEDYKRKLAIKEVWGEKGYTTIERVGIRPTLDVNGVWGGYTGEGAKTVLPSKAFAKISMRLVPNQDHKEIARLFEEHLKAIAPPSVTVKVVPHHGGQAAVVPTDSLGYHAAEAAIQEAFGKQAIPTREGGSIPITSLFQQALGLDPILMGFGLDTDAIHSPNEHYGVKNYFMGIETIALFFKHFSKLHKNS
ncbi:Acetylornithine deacetylase/Succinyl-diaminopimelate desuccinylase [Lunatimonas lonarensis]|uniref:Acetylornithine deacetylase/Succinyl-diaminopimelate desuccinylase n=1 Tax=Lunatimonas lonarensis TaxID=1232681 RepID=R7ZM18_9BACT|nr:dipeptidase [Lunatimonas lonarensis]EON75141.1 Acetylornithine deacetylase/Succinyl-diaminopimelate desuccinylase [Lunatimonas lonarensis]